jgi:hypothetical protein
MSDYKQSHVVSLRIDAALLEAVRARARAEGRSVSGQIVFLVREQIDRDDTPARAPKKISGWLSRRGPVPTLEELRAGRAAASKRIRAAIRRKARRT